METRAGSSRAARTRRPYDVRHSFISWALAAGLPTLDVARFAGTSTRMIDGVYGHLVKGSETAARERLDLFTAATHPPTGGDALDGIQDLTPEQYNTDNSEWLRYTLASGADQRTTPGSSKSTVRRGLRAPSRWERKRKFERS